MAKSGLRVVLVMLFFMYFAMFGVILMATSLVEGAFKIIIISCMLSGFGVFITNNLIKKYIGIEIKEEKLRKRDLVTEEFKDIYYKLFGEKITVNYFKSKKDFSAGKLVAGLFFAMIGIIALFVILEEYIWEFESFIEWGMLIVGCIVALISKVYISKYKDPEAIKDFKNQIIAPFVSMTNPKLKYYGICQEIEKMKEEYIKSEFDLINVNEMGCDDYIFGIMDNGNALNLCDLYANHVTTVYKDGEMQKEREELFSGLFGYIETDKYVSDTIRICLNNKFNHLKKNKIDIGSIEFENKFDVFAENKIEAMSIINADLIDAILEFYESCDIDFEINFKENRIYFRFITYSMFEAKGLVGEARQRTFNFYYSILKFASEFANKVSQMHDANEI